MNSRLDIVNALVSHYRSTQDETATIKLFDKYIKQYELSQWAIRTIIIEFREEVGITR